jgi:3-oxoacyl-[acyl-carrier protein] reductase
MDNGSATTRQVALVTGAGMGIGQGIARELGRRGIAVAVHYARSEDGAREVVEEIQGLGGEAFAIVADLREVGECRRVVGEASRRFGGLDILVNNAGIAILGDAATFAPEQFEKMVAINIRGVFVAIQAALAHLGEGGRIINIGSINADKVPGPGLAVYAMTKAAVAGLTRGLARDLGPNGITVNNIQPGPINTDMNPDQGEFAEMAKKVMAGGRYGQPSDIAGVVSYLAGPDTGYITGAHWNVDGGFTV